MKYKVEDSQCPNLAILNENITTIESVMEQDKLKVQTFFSERKEQRDQKRTKGLQKNKERYDNAIEAAKYLFANTPKLTWSAHQEAEARQKATCTIALEKYNKAAQAMEDIYADNALLLENDTIECQQRISEIDNYYSTQLARLHAGNKRALENLHKATTNYYGSLDEAHKNYHIAVAKAQRLNDLKCQEGFALYDKAYKTANEKYHELLFDAQMESFRMIAEAVGLDGVSSDVNSYMSDTDDPFDVIQPLLNYTDLRHALMMAARHDADTRIIEIFYDTFGGKTLYDTVRSFDLACNLQSYAHVCSFTSPVPPLSPNTLYVEFSSDEVICTVLCPYGSMITKSFDANSIFHLALIEKSQQLDWMKSCLGRNVSTFVLHLYYGNKASQYDAFSHALASVPELKEHMLRTIYTYNKEMIKAQGWGFAKLTKKHLYYSGRDNCPVVEAMPIDLICEIRDIAFAGAKRCYELSIKQAEEDYQAAVIEALYVKNEACVIADKSYEEQCLSIDTDVCAILSYPIMLLDTLSLDKPFPVYNRDHLMFFSEPRPAIIDKDDLALDAEIAALTQNIEYSSF